MLKRIDVRLRQRLWCAVIAKLCFAAQPTFAAHPLITEDTGTQGAGNWQLELTHGRGDHRAGTVREQSSSSAVVLSYGASERLDLILIVPHERVRTVDTGNTTENRGLGDIELAAKWRFLKWEDTSVALRPGLALPSGDEDKGLGSGRAVPSLFAVLSHEPGAWGFHLHLGYTRNRNVLGERRDIYHGSVAATYRSSPHWRWVTDVSWQTDPDPEVSVQVRSVVFGVIWSVWPDLDLDLGYRKGLSENTPDDTWLIGATFRF